MPQNILMKALNFVMKSFGVIFAGFGGLMLLSAIFDISEGRSGTPSMIIRLVIGLVVGGCGLFLFFKAKRRGDNVSAAHRTKSTSNAPPAESSSSSADDAVKHALKNPIPVSNAPILVPCEVCEKEISSTAGKCPSCGHPVSEKWVNVHRDTKDSPIPALGVLLLGIPLVIWAVVTFQGDSNSSPTQTQAASGCNPVDALSVAQFAVEEKLKSPSDADFPWPDIENQVSTTGECEYTVRSYVDAPNSFGGTVRTHFVVRLRYDKQQDDWRIQSVRFVK